MNTRNASTINDHSHTGLQFDLTVLTRRRLLGMSALGFGGLLIGCSSASSSDAATSTTANLSSDADGSTTSAATANEVSGATTAGGSATTITPGMAIPEETAGPYPGDGSNGPNILIETGVLRRDLRPSLTGSGVAAGLQTEMQFTVVSASSGEPLPGAAVYLWHCTTAGAYSMYTDPDETYLRGVQVANADGLVTFTTVHPGCYDGRWPHMHFEVYPTIDSITRSSNKVATSQVALIEEVAREVYQLDAYGDSLSLLDGVSLARDNVFSDGVEMQTPTVSGNTTNGLVLAMAVPVNL